MSCNTLTRLQIADSAGTLKEIEGKPGETDITGAVILAPTGQMAAVAIGQEVTLSAGDQISVADADLQAYYNELLLASHLPYLTSLTFTHPGASGKLHLLGTPCVQIGQFENKSKIQADAARLTISDLCPPCEDCADYERAYTRLKTISTWLTAHHASNFVSPASPQQLSPVTRLFYQYQAMLFMWNFMVQSQSYVLLVRAEGAFVRAWFGYYNANCDVTDPKFFLTFAADRIQTLDCVWTSANVLAVEKRFQDDFNISYNITTPTSGTFLDYSHITGPGTGTLKVLIFGDGDLGQWRYWTPEAGPWSAWQNDGDSVSLGEGIYTVEFLDVAGLATPRTRWVKVTADSTMTESGVYVSIPPPASGSPDPIGGFPWATFMFTGTGTMKRGDYFVAECLFRVQPLNEWDEAVIDCDAQAAPEGSTNHVIATGFWQGIFDGQVITRYKEAEPAVATPGL